MIQHAAGQTQTPFIPALSKDLTVDRREPRRHDVSDEQVSARRAIKQASAAIVRVLFHADWQQSLLRPV